MFDKDLGSYAQVGAPMGASKAGVGSAVITQAEEKKLRRAGVSGAARGLSTGMPQTRSLPALLRAIKTMRRLKADQDRAKQGADAMRAAKQIELTMRANALSSSKHGSPLKLPKATAWESIVGEETYKVGAVTRVGQSPAAAAAGSEIFRAIRDQEQSKVQKSLRAARSTGQLPNTRKRLSPAEAGQSPIASPTQTVTGASRPGSSRPGSRPHSRATSRSAIQIPGSPVNLADVGLAGPSKAKYEDLEVDVAHPVAE